MPILKKVSRTAVLPLITLWMILSSCTESLHLPDNKALSYQIQLGMTYLNQGDTLRAKQKFLTALASMPTSCEANGAMAYYYEKTEEKEQADQYYQKAIGLAPHKAAPLNNYGVFLCKNGNYTKALAYFMRAMQDDTYLHTADLYENAGFCAHKMGEEEKAATWLLKALQHDDKKKEALSTLIKIEMHRHHQQKVLEYLQKYSKLANQYPDLCRIGAKVARALRQKEMEFFYRKCLNKLHVL